MSPRRSPYGRVVEGLLTFATVCSLIVLVAGFLTKVDLWTAVGAVVGVVGLVSGLVALGLGILTIDVVAVAIMWAATSGARSDRQSWQDVFEGIAPHGALFDAHLSRMSDEHAEEIRIAIDEDDEFDPLAADPELS